MRAADGDSMIDHDAHDAHEGQNLRNVFALLGIVITTAGLAYFAFEFADVISPWGRVVCLVLLGVIYVALGAHFDQQRRAEAHVSRRSGWRWLRPQNALYVLGAVASFGGVIAFFDVPGLDRTWKVFVTLGLGLALILFSAKHVAKRGR